ncbi:hypothetical protein KJ940_14915 [Myxococcota bacterium]|nr:hypothetical protein [Myxococcota bacterium]
MIDETIQSKKQPVIVLNLPDIPADPNPDIQKLVPKKVYETCSPYREELRFENFYSCSYCSMSEIEAEGIGFAIEHYFPQEEVKRLPQLKKKINEYGNLFWSCERCNSIKSALPEVLKTFDGGPILYRPDKHCFRDHIEMDLDDFTLNYKTDIGEYTIYIFDMNDSFQVALRNKRFHLFENYRYIFRGIKSLKSIKIDQLPTHLRGIIIRKINEYSKQLGEIEDWIIRSINYSEFIALKRHTREERKYRSERIATFMKKLENTNRRKFLLENRTS